MSQTIARHPPSPTPMKECIGTQRTTRSDSNTRENTGMRPLVHSSPPPPSTHEPFWSPECEEDTRAYSLALRKQTSTLKPVNSSHQSQDPCITDGRSTDNNRFDDNYGNKTQGNHINSRQIISNTDEMKQKHINQLIQSAGFSSSLNPISYSDDPHHFSQPTGTSNFKIKHLSKRTSETAVDTSPSCEEQQQIEEKNKEAGNLTGEQSPTNEPHHGGKGAENVNFCESPHSTPSSPHNRSDMKRPISRTEQSTVNSWMSNPMNTEVSPMLAAAAAMAALSSGHFPTMDYSNPILPMGTSSNVQTSSAKSRLDNQHTPSSYFPYDLSTKDLSNIDDRLINPMHAMYNTSKIFFANKLANAGAHQSITPPPPALSASGSPQTSSSKELNRSTTMNYQRSYCEDEEEVEEDEDGMGREEEEQSLEGPDGNVLDCSEPHNNGQQWTFEEQFKQLYVLSDDPKRKEFLDELFTYMQRRGTPVNRIPIMAKQVLDLYELFQLVVARGGLVEVINKKLWREITKGLNLPSSITSAAFTLRTQYMKYLYPYECDTLGMSTAAELQAAIDGNRREARRSAYSFEYPMMLNPHLTNNRPMSPSNLFVTSHSTSMIHFDNLTSVSGTNASKSQIPNIPVPFGMNGLNPMNPFLGFSPGTHTSLSQVQSSTQQTQQSTTPQFIPPPFFPSMGATGQFSANFNGLQPLGCTEDGNLDSSPTSNLFPNISNSFAAAAASIFGAGFGPSLPGAFASQPPGQSSSASANPSYPTIGPDIKMTPFTGTNSILNEAKGLNGMNKYNTSACKSRDVIDSGRFQENSPSPLNLVSTEDTSIQCINDGKESGSKKEVSNLNKFGNKSEEKSSITGKLGNKVVSECSKRPDSKENFSSSSPDDATTQSEEMVGERRENSTTKRTDFTKSDLPSIDQSNFDRLPCDDPMSNPATQAACQQIWAAAAALQNEIKSADEDRSNACGQNGKAVQSASHSGKRIISRSSEEQLAKAPRLNLPIASMDNRIGSRTPNPMKKSNRAMIELSRNHRPVDSTSFSNSMSGNNFSMQTPNVKIQTQSGAPMGLPHNAMVVTMELGTMLYQGVLFGQMRH